MSERERKSADRGGPFDVVAWPDRIEARVIEPGDEAAIHGYEVESDLAPHHPFTSTLYLSLTGELPAKSTVRALDVALTFLAPVAINEAPTHAAAVTRLCDGPARNVIAVAAVGLAERAHFVLTRHRAWLAWLADPRGPAPAEALSACDEDARCRERLRRAIGPTLELPAFAQPLSRDAAVIAVLFACGLRTMEQLEAIWTLAALPASYAEAMATVPKSFRDYPMDLPAFHYEEQR